MSWFGKVFGGSKRGSQDAARASAAQGAVDWGPTPPGSFEPTPSYPPPGIAGSPAVDWGPTPPGSFEPTPSYPPPGIAGSPWAQDVGPPGLSCPAGAPQGPGRYFAPPAIAEDYFASPPLGTFAPDDCPANEQERASQDYVRCQQEAIRAAAYQAGPPPLGTFAPDGCPANEQERASQDYVRCQQEAMRAAYLAGCADSQAAQAAASWAAASQAAAYQAAQAAVFQSAARSAEYDPRPSGFGPRKVDMESRPTSFGFDDDGPTTAPEDLQTSPDQPMKVEVKKTFVHVSEPGPPPGLPPAPPTMSFPISGVEQSIMNSHFRNEAETIEEVRRESNPSQKQEVNEQEKEEKRLVHERGECTPCAYFHQKQDACRKGYGCDFCHFCEKGELKKRKRQKAKELKAGSRPAATAGEAATAERRLSGGDG